MTKTQEAAAAMASLTERQRDVAVLLAKGYTMNETAALLGLTDSAARWARQQAFDRLGINKMTQLAVVCALAGLVTDWEADAA